MSKSKKAVSLIMAAVMVFSALPFSLVGNFANAADEGVYGGDSDVSATGSGTILTTSELLVDTSATDETVRIAAAYSSVSLPDYSNSGKAYIVPATDSGVPQIEDPSGSYDWRGLGYGGETPHMPQITMKIRYNGKDKEPAIQNLNIASPNITNLAIGSPSKSTETDSTGATWYVYTWALSSGTAQIGYVNYDSSEITTDVNGAKHLNGKAITWEITYKLGKRNYTQYAYSVAKEIVVPNGTLLYMWGDNARCSTVTQILAHNMESGWAVDSYTVDTASRGYVDFANGNEGDGSVPGMDGSSSSAKFICKVDSVTDSRAKLIIFEDSKSTVDIDTDASWDNNYSSNVWGGKGWAADNNRTLTTIYLDKNADKEDTLDSVNLRMTLKTGETSSFGAVALAQAVIKEGITGDNDLTSSSTYTSTVDSSEFGVYAYTPASRADSSGNNNEGQVLTGYFGDWFQYGKDGGSSSKTKALERMDWGDSDQIYNLSNGGSKTYNGDSNAYLVYNVGQGIGDDYKNYVLGSGNYLGTDDIYGSKFITLNFGGNPKTTKDYTLKYQLISSTNPYFIMSSESYTSFIATYRARATSYRMTGFTANSFHIQTYDTTNLYRLLNWIETGSSSKTSYSYSETYDGLTLKGINPQQDMYVSGWDNYIAAYKEAKRCIANYSITQTEIDNAYSALKTAYAALKQAEITIVINYIPHDVAGNIITSEIKTDTFSVQPGTDDVLTLGSEFTINRPDAIGNYRIMSGEVAKYTGTVSAEGGVIGYTVVEGQNTNFYSDKTTDADYSSDPATATLTFNFNYEPMEFNVTFVTNNSYTPSVGEAGKYIVTLPYSKDIFSDVTSSGSVLQTMLAAIGGKSHFHFDAITSDEALENEVITKDTKDNEVTGITVPANNDTVYYVRWAPDTVTYNIQMTGAKTGTISGQKTTLEVDGDTVEAKISKPADSLLTVYNTEDYKWNGIYYYDEACTKEVDFTKGDITAGYGSTYTLQIDETTCAATIYAKYVTTKGAIIFNPNGYIVKKDGTVIETSGGSFAASDYAENSEEGYGLTADNSKILSSFPQNDVKYPVPTKTGYTFTGWVTKDSSGKLVKVSGWTEDSADGATGLYAATANGTATVEEAGTFYYATWQPNQYEVILKLNISAKEMNRFCDKEEDIAEDGVEACYNSFIATVGEEVTDSQLYPYGTEPVKFGYSFTPWVHTDTWTNDPEGGQIHYAFDEETWPELDSSYSKIYLFPEWSSNGTDNLVYTSLDGYEVIADEAKRVDSKDLLDGETSESVAAGDTVDFRFTVSSKVYASSSSFIFAYDSDFYELPYTTEQYEEGLAYAVELNTSNPYVKGVGGENVQHYENIDTASLNALAFNIYDSATETYKASTYGAEIAAANKASDVVTEGAPFGEDGTHYGLVKVSIDPDVASMKSPYNTQTLNNDVYMFTLKLKVKDTAAKGSKGAVRFCSELLRTSSTLLGDVYIASTATQTTINNAQTVFIYGSNNKSLDFVNKDVYSVVSIASEDQTRTEYTINLALSYGLKVYGDTIDNSTNVPYFNITSYNGNHGYTMISTGTQTYYAYGTTEFIEANEKTAAGVEIFYENGHWFEATSEIRMTTPTVAYGSSNFTTISFTGIEGREIYTTFNDGNGHYYQTSGTGHDTASGFAGIPEAKRTYTSLADGTEKDAYIVTHWYAINTETGEYIVNEDGSYDEWIPGYYATAEQDGKTYAPYWEAQQVTYTWYDAKEGGSVVSVFNFNYDSTIGTITSTAPDANKKKTGWVATGANSEKEYAKKDVAFAAWRYMHNDEVAYDSTGTTEGWVVTGDLNFYPELGAILTFNVYHNSKLTADAEATRVNDYAMKFKADRQAALLALDGVMKDSTIGDKIFATEGTVIHLVPTAELATQFANTEINKPETSDIFITYEAFNNYIKSTGFNADATKGTGAYQNASFQKILGLEKGSTTGANIWTVYSSHFTPDESVGSTILTVSLSGSTGKAMDVKYKGEEVPETFDVASASEKFVRVDGTKATLLQSSDEYMYVTKEKGAYGDAYASTAVLAEKDNVYTVIGTKGTWSNTDYYGIYGVTHTLTASTAAADLSNITVHYLKYNAGAYTAENESMPQKTSGANKTNVVIGTKSTEEVPGWTFQNWLVADYTAATPTAAKDSNGNEITVKSTDKFNIATYKNYIKVTTTTTETGTTTAYDLYLVSNFKQNEYTVAFDLDGGNIGGNTTVDSQTGKHYGDVIDLKTIGTPTKTDWVFNGWSVDGATALAYTAESWTLDTTKADGSTITLTATWVKDRRNISFDKTVTDAVFSDADAYTITDNVATRGDAIDTVITAPTVTRDGYRFMGWYANEGFTGEAVTSFAILSTDTTYYAKWEKEYTVTFVCGDNGTLDGTLVVANKIKGENVTVPAYTANSGFKFNGWKADVQGISLADDAKSYTVGETDVTFTANFTEYVGNVKFVDTNCNEITSYGLTKKSNEKITAAQAALLKGTETVVKGYTFVGWTLAENTKSTGERTYYAEYDNGVTVYYIDAADVAGNIKTNNVEITTWSYVFTADGQTVTFYPVYEEIQITIDLDGDEGGDDDLPIDEYNPTTYDPTKYDKDNGRGGDEAIVTPTVNGYIYDTSSCLDEANVVGIFAGAITGEADVVVTPSKTVAGVAMYGTGTKIEIKDKNLGKTVEVYYLVIFGDVEGDGYCDATDLDIVNHQVSDSKYNWLIETGETEAEIKAKCYERAAQVNHAELRDNGVNSEDAAILDAYVFDRSGYDLKKDGTVGRTYYYYHTV